MKRILQIMNITPYLLWYNGFDEVKDVTNHCFPSWMQGHVFFRQEAGNLTPSNILIFVWEDYKRDTWHVSYQSPNQNGVFEVATWHNFKELINILHHNHQGYDDAIRYKPIQEPRWYAEEFIIMDQFGHIPLCNIHKAMKDTSEMSVGFEHHCLYEGHLVNQGIQMCTANADMKNCGPACPHRKEVANMSVATWARVINP